MTQCLARTFRFVWSLPAAASSRRMACQLVAAAPLLTACGEAPILDSELGVEAQAAQCGATWDLQDVELYNGSDALYSQAFVARYQGAFGKRCSGTLIGPNTFISVEHCDADAGSGFYFNCQVSASDPNPPDPEAAAAARCQRFEATAVSHYDGSVDVSVATLAGSPGSTYGWIYPTRRLPSVGEHLAVIQHPVHDGRRKMVGFGDVVAIDGKDLRYAIDTSGGSSGAGVLDAQGLLVAVHRASGCSESGGANTGTSMEYIFDKVPEVRSLLTAGWMSSMML
jgi:V8-like Glu-specific endopeptidase